MKLLFDHNLSPTLCRLLADAFPDSKHAQEFDLHESDDTTVWAFAIENDFTIVSKDSDFHQLAFAEGPPPKVIWIQRGNCSTGEIAEMLNRYCEEIFRFVDDEVTSFLALR